MVAVLQSLNWLLDLGRIPFLFGGAVLLLIVSNAVSTVRQYYRLHHIKGPLIACLSKWWLFKSVNSGKAYLDLYEVCKKYGSIARVGPNILVTSEPDLMKRMLNNILSMRDDEEHYKLRAKMVHGYSGKEVENLESKIDQNILALIKNILPSDKDPLGFGKIMGLAKEVAVERFGPNAKPQRDMLGSFIAHGLTREEAESEIILQIIGGTDTTATAIRSTMLYVMTNARIINTLRAEIASSGPAPPDSIISNDNARNMPYFQAVIKEGLRMHPPAVSLMSKEVPAGGDTFNGVYLPEGTYVGYCALGVMRRQDIWGADSSEFRPERWLEAAPEKVREMESTLELTFGYGRWQCLGRNVALIELNKVLFELFRRFEFVLIDPTKPWESIDVGVFIQRQFWIRVYKRE